MIQKDKGMQQELDRPIWSDLDSHRKAFHRLLVGDIITRFSKYGKYEAWQLNPDRKDPYWHIILITEFGYMSVGDIYGDVFSTYSCGAIWPRGNKLGNPLLAVYTEFDSFNNALNWIIETAEKRMDTLMSDAYSWLDKGANND